MKASTSRDYVFQPQSNKKMFLNFYTHNLQKIKLVATLSRTDESKDKDATAEFNIDRQTDVIAISTLVEKLCGQ